MSCWAVVPIRRRRDSKSRLRAALGPARHLALVRSMLRHVLDAARASAVDEVALLSPEAEGIDPGIHFIEDEAGSLNGALDTARAVIAKAGGRQMIVLPADLPLLQEGDVALLAEGCARSGCALAPDRHGSGTNALAVDLSYPWAFRFGPNSFSLHLAQTEDFGLTPLVVRSFSLLLDVDTAQDLALLEQAPLGRIAS